MRDVLEVPLTPEFGEGNGGGESDARVSDVDIHAAQFGVPPVDGVVHGAAAVKPGLADPTVLLQPRSADAVGRV